MNNRKDPKYDNLNKKRNPKVSDGLVSNIETESWNMKLHDLF